MQRKYPLEPNAPSQLLLSRHLKPCPPADPTKNGRVGNGEIGMEIVPKGKRPVAANRRRSLKAAEGPRLQSRIPTW